MQTNTTNTYVYPPAQPQPNMYVYPPAQPQPVPVQTKVVSMSGPTYGAEKSVGLGVAEIILRVICLILCLVTLSAAAVAVSAVNDIDDYVGDFKHADSYRGAAGWLVFVGLAAVVYHAIMIFIRIIYFAANIGRSFAGFSFTNAALCFLFGLALLAGAVANSVYASDNQDLYDDSICSRNYYYSDLTVCDDLERLYISEGAAAGFAFLSMVIFIPLFIISLVNGIRKMREMTNQGSHDFASAPTAPYVHLPNEY